MSTDLENTEYWVLRTLITNGDMNSADLYKELTGLMAEGAIGMLPPFDRLKVKLFTRGYVTMTSDPVKFTPTDKGRKIYQLYADRIDRNSLASDYVFQQGDLDKLEGDSLDAICEVIGAPRDYNDGKSVMRKWFLNRLSQLLNTRAPRLHGDGPEVMPVYEPNLWRPPETAPKDGSVFEITTAGPQQDFCFWDKDGTAYNSDTAYFSEIGGSQPCFRDYYHRQRIKNEWPYMIAWRPLTAPAKIGNTPEETRQLNGWPPL